MTQDIPEVENLWPEDLDAYIESHHDKQFLIVDVRQPQEYAVRHIPGAKLIPLPQLMENPGQLPKDRELVFYCASGSRSAVAAAMANESAISDKPLYNLMGGVYAWEGRLITGLPKMRVFDLAGAIEDMLATAIKLEKGAQEFYTGLRDRYQGEPRADVYTRLAEAEIRHATTVYRQLKQRRSEIPVFDDYFREAAADMIEGGMSVQEAIQSIAAIDENSCLRSLELALDIELAAYDLYRTVANRLEEDEFRDIFYGLSQAEKGHMRQLSDAFSICPLED